MNLLFWGLTVSMVGKVLVAIGVLKAHTDLAHERRVDQLVIKSFRLEHTLTVTGLLLIVFGYMMEIYFYDFVNMLNCPTGECVMNAAALMAQ